MFKFFWKINVYHEGTKTRFLQEFIPVNAEPAPANALILTNIFGGQNSDGKCCKTAEACIAK